MIPPYLKAGSTIGITCPSSYVAFEKVKTAAAVLESKDFRIKYGSTVSLTPEYYFAGHDEERLDDLQYMLDDDNIDAILMGRGGYGMSRIVDKLDLSAFKKNPKWICGFSDITVLHSHIQAKLGMPVLHSPMCGAFRPEVLEADYLQSFFSALTGSPLQHNIPASSYNRQGTCQGLLTGGNLAILAHLTGSVSEVDTTGKILFLEDIGEYLYNIDRMLLNLKRAGKLDNLKGLVLGGFTDMKDTDRPFGQTVEQIILDKVAEYTYPVCFNFPAGHHEENYTLCLGMNYSLSVSTDTATLKLIR